MSDQIVIQEDGAYLLNGNPKDNSIEPAEPPVESAAPNPAQPPVESAAPIPAQPTDENLRRICSREMREVWNTVQPHIERIVAAHAEPYIDTALDWLIQNTAPEAARPLLTELKTVVVPPLTVGVVRVCGFVAKRSYELFALLVRAVMHNVRRWIGVTEGCMKVVIKIDGDKEAAELFKHLTFVSATLTKLLTTETLKAIQPELDEIAKSNPKAVKIVSKIFQAVLRQKIRFQILCDIDDVHKALHGKEELTLTMVPTGVCSPSLAPEHVREVIGRFSSYTQTSNALQRLLIMEEMEPILHLKETTDGKTAVFPLASQLLEKAITDPKFKDIPFFVVSMIGGEKTDRSFLRRLLISKLRYQEKAEEEGPGWIYSNASVDEVEWKQDGVVWSRPFLYTTDDKKQVAVILMDCQGLHGSDPSQEVKDALITLHSFELSKLQVFTSLWKFHPSDFEKCIEGLKTNGFSHLQNALVMLTSSPGYKGEMEKGFKEVKEYSLPVPRDLSAGISLNELMEDENSAEFVRHVDGVWDQVLKAYATQPEFLRSQMELRIILERLTKYPHSGLSPKVLESGTDVFKKRKVLSIVEKVEDVMLPSIRKIGFEQDAGKPESALTKTRNFIEEDLMEKIEREHPGKPNFGKEIIKETVKQWFHALEELRKVDKAQGFGDKPMLDWRQKFEDTHKVETTLYDVSLAARVALSASGEGKALKAPKKLKEAKK